MDQRTAYSLRKMLQLPPEPVSGKSGLAPLPPKLVDFYERVQKVLHRLDPHKNLCLSCDLATIVVLLELEDYGKEQAAREQREAAEKKAAEKAAADQAEADRKAAEKAAAKKEAADKAAQAKADEETAAAAAKGADEETAKKTQAKGK